MVHVRIWKFRPPEDRVSEFAAAYGSDGAWPKLFARGEGYLGTELLGPSEGEGWWLTIDRWRSAADFGAFQREYGDEYRTLDAELEGLVGEEQLVGAFEDLR
jgi:heme-degrading monooxygenase HmoA